MKKHLIILLLISFVFSCKKEKITQLNFLDEFVLADSLKFQNDIIGGLSGIDYSDGFYYFIVDDAKNPRFLKAQIHINNLKIDTILFKNTIRLKDTTIPFFNENALDLESIFIDNKTKNINFISEGSIRKNKKPSIFTTDKEGRFVSSLKLPKSFKNISEIRHNAVFEGSSKSVNKNGFWVSIEKPLKTDGEEPTFKKTSSPIRITYFDNVTKTATKQYAYQLENITKPAKGKINLNGVTAILEYKENHFLVIERTYQSGYGEFGNIVRIFEAKIDDKTTNIIDIESLKETEFTPLKKRLLLNFDDIKTHLTEGIVDNLEGITFGPKLANGNQSLLLVSDDNFQIYGKQLNQFILLEIKNK